MESATRNRNFLPLAEHNLGAAQSTDPQRPAQQSAGRRDRGVEDVSHTGQVQAQDIYAELFNFDDEGSGRSASSARAYCRIGRAHFLSITLLAVLAEHREGDLAVVQHDRDLEIGRA